MNDSLQTRNMTPEQRSFFNAEYDHAAKNELLGVLLALFLGGLGVHRFYLGQPRLGLLYLVFSWTGIPTILGFVECFFMPRRVREVNAMQADLIMADMMEACGEQSPVPQQLGPQSVCSECRHTMLAGTGFCPICSASKSLAK